LEWLSSGGTLLVPTRRLAFRLREEHDLAMVAAGRDTWPTADVVTWDDLVQRLFALGRDAGSNLRQRLSSRAARLVWERIVRDDPSIETTTGPRSLAALAQRAWRRLHEYRIPYSALASPETAEQAAFARWVDAYRRRLAEDGWIDDASLDDALDWTLLDRAPIAIAGFDELTPRQREWVDRARAAGHDVSQVAPPRISSEVSRVACDDSTDEFDRAARWAAAWLDAVPDARLAVIVTDLELHRERVRRAFDRVFEPTTALTGGPRPGSRRYAFAAARSLVDWPIVAAALDLIDLFSRPLERTALLRFLREPHVAGAEQEASARALVEQRLSRRSALGLDFALVRTELARSCPVLLASLERALEKVSGWPAFAAPSVWALEFSQLLQGLGWPSAPLDSAEHQARERWFELLVEHGGCDIVTGPVRAVYAADLLRQLALEARFEPEQPAASLLVIDPQTSAGMRFDGLWLTGVDATRWPAASAPDPFLPRAWQVRRRLPGATGELRRDHARTLFARVLGSAAEVIVSHPRSERTADLPPSPLLASLPERSPALAWPIPPLTRTLFDARPDLETRAELAFPEPSMGAVLAGGASVLKDQSACPFRAQARWRLGAQPLETPRTGIDAALRGQLLHDALAWLWGELGDSTTLARHDAGSVRDLIEAAIAAAQERRPRALDAVAVRVLQLETEWLRARIEEFVELDRRRPEFTVIDRELPIRLEAESLSLDLRIDRLDRLRTGGHAIVDYKTGRDVSLSQWTGERPVEPQIPAYTLALAGWPLEAAALAALRTGETRYLGLARDKESFPELSSPGDSRLPRDIEDWPTLLEKWRRRITALMRELRLGDASLAFVPAVACRDCHLHALCRIDASESIDVDATENENGDEP
jgi:probable DNA repair protein